MDTMELVETATTPMQSNTLDELAAALAKAQGEMMGAKKDSKNPFFKSNYADLASICEAIREPFSKHGLSYIQTTEQDGTVITTLLHSSGQWIRGRLKIDPVKKDPQGMGSALTYARRYALAAISGIAQIDDDAESAMARGQMTSAPLNIEKINQAIDYIKTQIIEEDPDTTGRKLKAAFAKLNNDERIEVNKGLQEIVPGTKKKFKSVLNEYLNMPEQLHSAANV